jgi:hypothetical protein
MYLNLEQFGALVMRSISSNLTKIAIGLSVLMLPQGLALACPPRSMVTSPLKCLPNGIQATSIVFAEIVNGKVKQTTVQQTLTRMSARCKGNQLVDGKGRKVAFFQFRTCGGAAPTPQMIQERQQEQANLMDLKKRFQVIEMTCTPGGYPLP